MCGLVGVLERNGRAEDRRDDVVRAADAIAHRGPDDEGFFFDGPVGLGFRRLAILDLTPAGHQPLASQDGAWTVVFNGEIYNFIELASELSRSGVQFRSHCDTEVLVEALALWGTRAFERFNGMWAVLAWHKPTRTLYACRDPWGIKPLYVTDQGSFIAFCSEIKGLRALGCQHEGINATGARRYLDSGILDADNQTLFSGIERLLPGYMYRWRDGQALPRQRYADGTQIVDVPPFCETPSGEEEFKLAFRDAMLNSIRLRLRSDVDVGTCLSGGLDSTMIACAAARFLEAGRGKSCRHAFTALLEEYDETRFILPVLAQTGATWHTTVAADAQLIEKASAYFLAHDEPTHSLSPFAGYLVMELAAKANVKVLLNGQGADELLAGYNSTVGPFLRSVAAENGTFWALLEAKAEAGSIGRGAALLARTMAASAVRAVTPGGSQWWHYYDRVLQTSPTQNAKVRRDGPLGALPYIESQPSGSLKSALAGQVEGSPLPLYLRIEDTNSSAFSLEARLPFLDPAVVALARATPARMLRRGGMNKYLLRSILPGLVPDAVWQRKEKMGFPVPSARWLRGPLREIVLETLSPQRLAARGWYDVAAVLTSRDHVLSGAEPEKAQRLLRVFLLERWARDHLDAAPVAVTRRSPEPPFDRGALVPPLQRF